MKYLGETSLTKLITLIKTSLSGKQNKITANGLLKGDGDGGITAVSTTYTDTTISADRWSSGEYSFETDYPQTSYNISVSVSPTATSAQFDAFANAKICGNATTNTIKALGTVPTVDIPVIVKAVGK